MIVGIGVDAVPVERMRAALARTPRLAVRVFTPGELGDANARASRDASLAARFAAKEACRKALGRALPWLGIEVVTDRSRAPSLRVRGHDDVTFHVSLTHTEDIALAMVVAER